MSQSTRSAQAKSPKQPRRFDRADLRQRELADASLAHGDFRGAELDGSNLERAQFEEARLERASLREAFLVSANLRGAKLDKADLDGANLRAADLQGADLSRANLGGANLDGANLKGAILRYAQLDGATLRGALLDDARLDHADLREADLRDASFRAASLHRAVLDAAKLEGAVFERARLDNASMRHSMLREARLADASLADADLSHANLTRADLRRVDLRGSIVDDACFDATELALAKVYGVDFRPAHCREIPAATVDLSRSGDNSELRSWADIVRHESASVPASVERFFGAGDILRNAELEFHEGARVRIESRLEDCRIVLSADAELVIGPSGVLQRCTITGGKLSIFGALIEGAEPSLYRPQQLFVSATGRIVATIVQGERATRFGFERGSRLHLTIHDPASAA